MGSRICKPNIMYSPSSDKRKFPAKYVHDWTIMIDFKATSQNHTHPVYSSLFIR